MSTYFSLFSAEASFWYKSESEIRTAVAWKPDYPQSPNWEHLQYLPLTVVITTTQLQPQVTLHSDICDLCIQLGLTNTAVSTESKQVINSSK